ncbi:MAG: VCBS repeat-containing protein [Caldilineales bacterium]|nr:VCBS repeat-containing protein [Caldilineales bacterium]
MKSETKTRTKYRQRPLFLALAFALALASAIALIPADARASESATGGANALQATPEPPPIPPEAFGPPQFPVAEVPEIALDTLLSGADPSTKLAWGDYDQDGDLDLAIANSGKPNRLFRNDQGRIHPVPVWESAESDYTTSLAWGDVDSDGDLDLVIGNRPKCSFGAQGYTCRDGNNRIYRNEKGALSPAASWSSAANDSTWAIALGDVNGDGLLDLAAANSDIWQLGAASQGLGSGKDKIYLNNGSGAFEDNAWWTSPESAYSSDIELGDVDDDGDLDLLIAGAGAAVYKNIDGALSQKAVWSSDGGASAIALADVDGDGYPELVVGEVPGALLYDNLDGEFETEPYWKSSWPEIEVSDFSIGDFNADGDLDIAASASCYVIAFCPLAVWSNADGFVDGNGWDSGENVDSGGVAWGDMDGDGTLELAAAVRGGPSQIYVNDTTPFKLDSNFEGFDYKSKRLASAWGDVDGDGDLDLAVGVGSGAGIGAPNVVLHNDGGYLAPEPMWTSAESDDTQAVAWGDMDGDGDLDLAVGNLADCDLQDKELQCSGGKSQVYRNDGGVLTSSPVWTSTPQESTTSVAWGDVDGDGDLDLAVGDGPSCEWDSEIFVEYCQGGQNYIFFNDGEMLSAEPGWTSAESDDTQSVAWGDVDDDGDLDLAVGNECNPSDEGCDGAPNRVYYNFGGQLETSPSWSSSDSDFTTSVAWGDVDNDGDLDLAVGNSSQAARLYINEGGRLGEQFVWTPPESGFTGNVAWGDADGDGDLDLAVNDAEAIMVYENVAGQLSARSAWTDYADSGQRRWATWGDMDNDGDQDLVAGERVFRNMISDRLAVGGSPQVFVSRPQPDDSAAFYSAAAVWDELTVPFAYSVLAEPDASADIQAFYALNGPGDWQPAVPVTGTNTTGLRGGKNYSFMWDVAAAGLMGQSDNVVMRMVALPDLRPHPNQAAGPYQYGGNQSVTFPLRVRGTQVQVFSETTDNPAAGAMVYRLPAEQLAGAQPLGGAGGIYRTDAGGFLQGRGQIDVGDTLYALWPVSTTLPIARWNYDFVHTSFTPVEDGVEGYVVEEPGVQTLVVSEKNPLILFNLDMALEWDARNDGAFLADLQEAIKRSSELFYDVSDGQMAIGDVNIFQNKQNWLASDVVMYANNSIRPRASMGGVVAQSLDDVRANGETIANAFQRGQIRIGPVWDPFGQSRDELRRDWQRAFAHEFGHYLLFLPDNYLGYEEDGSVGSADCEGSFMTTAYDDDYSEFLTAEQWAETYRNCLNTLAERTTGRSDWETIKKFYPMLSDDGDNPGPLSLPLDLTRVRIADDSEPSNRLPARNFDLRDAVTGERLPLAQGQGYLYKTQGTSDLADDRLVLLGSTGKSDWIKVRGSDLGDRVCVFESNTQPAVMGCANNIKAVTNVIKLRKVENWRPSIRVQPTSVPAGTLTITSPITSAIALSQTQGISITDAISATAAISPTEFTTHTIALKRPALTIEVEQPLTSGQMRVQVLPAHGAPNPNWPVTSPWVVMNQVDPANSGVYSATIPLDYPVFSGYVRVWVPGSPQEAISQFYITPVLTENGGFGYTAENPYGFGPDDRFGYGPDDRFGYGPDDRFGYGPDDRFGYGPDDRFGYGPDDRFGYGPDDRFGYGPDDRFGYGPDDRFGYGPDDRFGYGVPDRGLGANRRALGAPIASDDGQVSIFNKFDAIGDPGAALLEALAAIPNLPQWLSPVGQAYRFVAQGDVDRTIGFNYLRRDVPDGYEHTLQIYYSPDEGQTWSVLPSRLDTDENLVTAPADESGLYVSAASVDIPLVMPGWNLIAYPIPETRPITEALASIDGYYSTVYGFDNEFLARPWTVFDVEAPELANDLKEMKFGQGYWINVTAPVILKLAVPKAAAIGLPIEPIVASQPLMDAARLTPPAVFYGQVELAQAPAASTPLEVQAMVGDTICGVGEAKHDGQSGLVYVVKVEADEPASPDCGAPGRKVMFTVDSQRMSACVPWDNTRTQNVTLQPADGTEPVCE